MTLGKLPRLSEILSVYEQNRDDVDATCMEMKYTMSLAYLSVKIRKKRNE